MLVLVSTARGVVTALAAIVVGMAGPLSIVYLLAVVSTVAATLFRPAHSALLPSLCRTGHELASANVVRGLLDSVATLAGPLLAAIVLQFTGVTAVFAVAAAASLWAAALMLQVHYEAPPRPPAPAGVNLIAQAAEGVRAVVRNPDLAILIGLTAAQAFTRGALTVFSVVVALDLLDTGEPGVGTLTAAVEAGAVLGSLAASLPVGSRDCRRPIGDRSVCVRPASQRSLLAQPARHSRPTIAQLGHVHRLGSTGHRSANVVTRVQL